jgi:hypothetical protein
MLPVVDASGIVSGGIINVYISTNILRPENVVVAYQRTVTVILVKLE